MRTTNRRRGFSLIELMTVIAIIALLVAVAVPSLTAARDAARRSVTQGTIKGLEQGCEAFQKETGSYPVSRGLNPFDGDAAKIPLSGSQWLALQLSGPDMRGYVQPITGNDTDKNGKIDEKDWQAWYPSVTSTNPQKQWGRIGPYGPVDAKYVKHIGDPNSPDGTSFMASNPGSTIPAIMTQTTQNIWPGYMLPFYVDAWGYPILYYAATPRAQQPYSTGNGASFQIGVYDQSDNAGWTGIRSLNGRYAELYDQSAKPSFSSSDDTDHPIAVLGYDPLNPGDRKSVV